LVQLLNGGETRSEIFDFVGLSQRGARAGCSQTAG